MQNLKRNYHFRWKVSNFVYALLFLLIVLFVGDPDIHDGLVSQLSCSKPPTILVVPSAPPKQVQTYDLHLL